MVSSIAKSHRLLNLMLTASASTQTARHLRIDGRDQIDYFTPSSGLFDDFCHDIVERYDLNNLIHKAEVTNISYGDVGIATEKARLFTVTTTNNQTYFARTVVLATGPSSTSSLPPNFKALQASNPNSNISHIFDKIITQPSNLPSHVHRLLSQNQPVHIAIVGGGLSSAQTVTHLLTHHPNITKIHLLCRSRLKIKPFDVSLNWISKLRNHAMSAFWSADTDEERVEMLSAARNGGSIPPAWDKILKKHALAGRLSIHEEVTVNAEHSTWNDELQEWDLTLSPTGVTDSDNVTKTLRSISHLLLATSQPPDIDALPFLAQLRSEHPVASIKGLPRITHELKWRDDVPLFLTGALAGLRLGPGAGNLAGARLGAERVAAGIGATKGQLEDGAGNGIEKSYTGGFENRFGGLVLQ